MEKGLQTSEEGELVSMVFTDRELLVALTKPSFSFAFPRLFASDCF